MIDPSPVSARSNVWACFIIFCGTLTLLAAGIPDNGLKSTLFGMFSPPGIATPSPVAPYFNGVFPDKTPGVAVGGSSWEVVEAYPALTFNDPIAMIQIPDLSGFYVAGKPGYIWKIDADTTTNQKQLLLDIHDVVHTDGDAGLSNMVLHPEFAVDGSENEGFIYVIYRYHPNGDAIGNCEADAYTRLSRFTKFDDQEAFDPSTELVLIQQVDRHCWHTGSAMFFDDEGYLYFTFGDEGRANDIFHTSQKIDTTLFGGLHRIDVDKDLSRSHPIRRQPIDPPHNLPEGSYTQEYYIPNDNPWQSPDSSVLEEFFALGLRSPHRGSYDPLTGQIWIADVGQGAREEISIVAKGDNLQWPFKEGSIDGPKPTPVPLIGTSRAPVYDYGHDEGLAVIGGFVYRGAKYNSALDGKFIFADHSSRNIYALNTNDYSASFIAQVPEGGVGDKNGISSFATDVEGNIYILKLFGTDLDGGMIYKLNPTAFVPDPPALLSNLGVFSDLSELTPESGFIPYSVNSPLWSDRAEKKRWVAVPNDGTHDTSEEQITFSKTQPWKFPPGTVFMKNFALPVDDNDPNILTNLETRFIVVLENEEIYGLTYKWRADGTEADLLTTGDEMTYNITQTDQSVVPQNWNFPSRTNCLSCHNNTSGKILGPKTWQLNGDHTYDSGITDNQLNTWQSLGMFSNPFNPIEITTMLKSTSIDDESEDLSTRVRSYLDANCAHCHQPNVSQGAFDARFSTPWQAQNLILSEAVSVNSPPGSVIVQPGDPTHSELWLRDNKLGALAMPPLAKNIIDTAYISVLTDWINSTGDSTCYVFYLSDLTPTSSTNGWGPIEFDQSNGSTNQDDGFPMTINGQTFPKGLGVHGNSEVVYDLNGEYASFRSHIGVDDATCFKGSVRFSVMVDDILTYESPEVIQGDEAIALNIDVMGANKLTLLVDSISSKTCDHGDWAGARLIKVCDDGDACTENDVFDNDCNCAGTLIDYNGDGICDSLNFELAIKVYLEGAFSSPYPGEESLMRDDLRNYSFIPTQSPYGDTTTCDATVFDITGPDAIVDWIKVELRDPLDLDSIVESKTGLLQRDGDIVDPNGIDPLIFSVGQGLYHVLVKHRNHLGVITENALTLGDGPLTNLDFTDGSVLFSGPNPTVLLEGKACFWAGDTDNSKVVDAGDRSITWNNRNDQSYHGSDCNLDGVTDASDRSITWNNRNQYALIPN